jgi:hypothetical protein
LPRFSFATNRCEEVFPMQDWVLAGFNPQWPVLNFTVAGFDHVSA